MQSNHEKMTRAAGFMLLIGIITAALALICGCGGGGSGPAPVTTGTLRGYVDMGAVARQAGRSAELTPMAAAQLTFAYASASYTAAADDNGYFQVELPPGDFIEVTAAKNNVSLKCFANVTLGQATTKNVNARTTAAAMVHKRLVAAGAATPQSITTIENATIISPVETEVETGLVGGNYVYNTVYSGVNVTAVINKIQAGGSFTDSTPPVAALSYPAQSAEVSDVDFRAEAFYIQFSYSDANGLYTGAMRVTLSMDGGAAHDITNYFSLQNGTQIRSANLYQFTRTLFGLPSNNTARTMTVNLHAEDLSGNAAAATGTFTVYPLAPQTPQ